MQLSIFENDETDKTPKKELKPIEYYYIIRLEQKIINPKDLSITSDTVIKTIHAVFTDLDKVREMIDFLKSMRSYCGWHHIIRSKQMPKLNYSTWMGYL